MKTIWRYFGRVLYILFWLPLYLLLGLTTRTRILVLVNNKLLVVKGWIGANKWMLPGGGLHRGESLETGVLRELREETGVIIKDQRHIQRLGPIRVRKFMPRKHELFVVELPSRPQTKKQRFEIIDIAWIDLESLDTIQMSQDVLAALDLWRSTN